MKAPSAGHREPVSHDPGYVESIVWFFLIFASLVSVISHFTGDHHDCEYYLLATIAFALLAIATKKD